jgi:hypothetical protein
MELLDLTIHLVPIYDDPGHVTVMADNTNLTVTLPTTLLNKIKVLYPAPFERRPIQTYSVRFEDFSRGHCGSLMVTRCSCLARRSLSPQKTSVCYVMRVLRMQRRPGRQALRHEVAHDVIRPMRRVVPSSPSRALDPIAIATPCPPRASGGKNHTVTFTRPAPDRID